MPATHIDRFLDGLENLLLASTFAHDTGVSAWEYAVDVETLSQVGVTVQEVRWLLAKRFVQHRIEVTRPGDRRRSFLPCNNMVVGGSSAFVLTETGYEFATNRMRTFDRLQRFEEAYRGEPCVFPVTGPILTGSQENPQWDAASLELRLGDVLLRQLREDAANQIRILAAFEEEGWPTRIDDPLPPHGDVDPRQRLRDTIRRLNQRHKVNALRFSAAGHSEQVCWRLVRESRTEHDERA